MRDLKKERIAKQRKLQFYLIAFISIAIIASLSIPYFGNDNLFPDKLGDMELKLHREGDVAVNEIKGSHSAKDKVNPEEAHVARYRNSAGNRATVYVTVAESSERAVELVENMNKGMGGMFSLPEIMEINGLKIYYTEGGDEYHYYYSNNNFVVWIALNNPDKAYQLMLVNETVRSVGE